MSHGLIFLFVTMVCGEFIITNCLEYQAFLFVVNGTAVKCNQLAGACEKEFHANTFEEMAEMSKQHGMEMFQKNDEAHLNAMKKMQERMQTPEAMKAWFDNKKKEFNALPED